MSIQTYKNGKFTDLAIKAKDNVEVRGHKLILYAQNAWFARLEQPKNENSVNIREDDQLLVVKKLDYFFMYRFCLIYKVVLE